MTDKISSPGVLVLREGFEHLFLSRINGVEVIFRPLNSKTLRAAKAALRTAPAYELNETVCLASIISIEGVDDIKEYICSKCPAGYPDILAELILGVSSFQDVDSLFEMLTAARADQQRVENEIELFICLAFRTLTPEYIRSLDIYSQMDLLAKAEVLLGTEFGNKKRKAKDMLRPEAADKPDFNSALP